MIMSGYLLRPCKSTAAYEALPDAKGGTYKLHLDSCLDILKELGYVEVCNAKVMIILKKDLEVTIYPSGKLIIKTDSKLAAESMMNEIYHRILG
jgi:hypothetical protein